MNAPIQEPVGFSADGKPVEVGFLKIKRKKKKIFHQTKLISLSISFLSSSLLFFQRPSLTLSPRYLFFSYSMSSSFGITEAFDAAQRNTINHNKCIQAMLQAQNAMGQAAFIEAFFQHVSANG